MRGERWEPTRIEGPQGFRARGFQSASHTAPPRWRSEPRSAPTSNANTPRAPPSPRATPAPPDKNS